MPRFPRHQPDPWLRSSTESLPRHLDPRRRPTRVEVLLAAIVVAGIIAFAIWFLFLARGGPGWGTV